MHLRAYLHEHIGRLLVRPLAPEASFPVCFWLCDIYLFCSYHLQSFSVLSVDIRIKHVRTVVEMTLGSRSVAIHLGVHALVCACCASFCTQNLHGCDCLWVHSALSLCLCLSCLGCCWVSFSTLWRCWFFDSKGTRPVCKTRKLCYGKDDHAMRRQK